MHTIFHFQDFESFSKILPQKLSSFDFRYNRVEIDKEIEQMKKDDSYKEDEDFESNYYRANKIKVKKVIVQGKSSKISGNFLEIYQQFFQGRIFSSKNFAEKLANFEKIKHLMLSGHHQFEWRLYSTWCLEHF